jgi:hypothetical protein
MALVTERKMRYDAADFSADLGRFQPFSAVFQPMSAADYSHP